MTPASSPPSPAPAFAGEVFCAGCDYNLQGRRPDTTVCPECGHPIANSVKQAAKWGGRSLERTGGRLFFLAALLVLLLACGPLVFTRSSFLEHAIGYPRIVTQPLVMMPFVALAMCVWRLTSDSDWRSPERFWPCWRSRLIRISAANFLILALWYVPNSLVPGLLVLPGIGSLEISEYAFTMLLGVNTLFFCAMLTGWMDLFARAHGIGAQALVDLPGVFMTLLLGMYLTWRMVNRYPDYHARFAMGLLLLLIMVLLLVDALGIAALGVLLRRKGRRRRLAA